MCFSATADFVSAGVIGTVGVLTLTQVRTARDIPFASLPMLFALHQFTEGFVWLSLDGDLCTRAGNIAAFIYVLYAFGLLPILVPLALLLIEPPGRRRLHMVPFVVIGAAVSIYLFWATLTEPVQHRVVHHSIAYSANASLLGLVAVGYVVATVGAALLTGYRAIVAFGILNAIGLTVVFIVLRKDFASIWCFWAALTSVLVLVFFLRRNRAQGTDVRRHQQEPPARGRRDQWTAEQR